MLLIGLLIAVAVVVFVGVVLAENWGGSTFTVDGFGRVLGHLTLAEIFLAGVVLTALFFVALWMMSISSRLRRRASSRRRAETRAAREEHDSLVAERDRLSTELEAARVGRADRTVADRPVAYPRASDVYGDRVDPSNIDAGATYRENA
jgi:uncharacterized membrane protein